MEKTIIRNLYLKSLFVSSAKNSYSHSDLSYITDQAPAAPLFKISAGLNIVVDIVVDNNKIYKGTLATAGEISSKLYGD